MLTRFSGMSDWYSAAQVAELIGISQRRVEQLMASGHLPFKGRPRKVNRTNLNKFIAGRWPALELKRSL